MASKVVSSRCLCLCSSRVLAAVMLLLSDFLFLVSLLPYRFVATLVVGIGKGGERKDSVLSEGFVLSLLLPLISIL